MFKLSQYRTRKGQVVCSQNSKIDPLPGGPLPGQTTALGSRTLPELRQGSQAQMTRMGFITEQLFRKGKLASLKTRLWLSGKTGKATEEGSDPED